MKENVKKMKSALHSKQLLLDAQKKEMTLMTEKLKVEEQSRKSLQKVNLGVNLNSEIKFKAAYYEIGN